MRVLGAIVLVTSCGGAIVNGDAGTDATTNDAASDVIAAVDAFDEGVDTGEPDVAPLEASIDTGPSCGTIQLTGSSSTTYQIDSTHSGWQPNDQLAFPLCKRWSHVFAGALSYPVVGDGLVFVTATDTDGTTGTDLYALDASTGGLVWGPTFVKSFYKWSVLAYDAGRVFATSADGLAAFDAKSGAPLWTAVVDSFTAPTPWNGRLYMSAGGFLEAYDEEAGTAIWSKQVNGGECSPAIDSTGAYVSYACDQAYAFDPLDGGQRWHYSSWCSGGGGRGIGLGGGMMYTRDTTVGNLTFNALDGAIVDSGWLGSWYTPTIVGTNTMLVTGGGVVAYELPSFTKKWTWTQTVLTPALVVGSNVVVGVAPADVYVLDLATGTPVANDSTGGSFDQAEDSSGRIQTGFAAANGMLFVVAHDHLVAY